MTNATPAKSTSTAIPPAILSLIGNTPLVEITRMDTGPCQLFVKLENQNPTGSIKDRIALSMVEAAEREGKLKPGGTIIEATAGNTGLGLALIAGAKGYRIILVIPDKMSQEKIAHVRALGAEVRLTRSDVTRGHPEYYQDVAANLTAEIPGAFYVNQFGNPANPLAHEPGTGPEIWEQMDHDLDAVVVGVGSGGTLTGLGRFFKKVQPNLEMILADPTGSILYEWVKTGKLEKAGSWAVEGIGEDFIPDIADMSLRHRRLRDRRRRKLRRRARAPRQRGNPRRLLDRHAARGCAPLLPPADKQENASSPSFVTRAISISRRCLTISGWRSRASWSVPPRAI